MIFTDSRHHIQGWSFDSIYFHLLKQLSESPQYICSPRGQKIKENLAVTLVLDNPRARLLSCKKRNTNYGFAVGEFLWYWQGKQDLETMLYYNKRMKDYSDDGETLNSAYGHRLKGAQDLPLGGISSISQWEVAVATLKQDSDSRRAVLHINRGSDQLRAVLHGSKDVPCTLSLQFFVRQNRLELHVHMRSNDVMWGLTYDLYSFTLFQECMLLELQQEEKFKDLRLGAYYHTAGSLHLYEPHFEQAAEIVREYGLGVELQRSQKPLESLHDLDRLAEVEESLRTGSPPKVVSTYLTAGLDTTAEWMADRLLDHRIKRDAERK